VTVTDMRDAEQVARLCKGDVAAAQSLYQRHGDTLLRFSVAMVRCLQTAEDVVHDSFIELIQRPHGFDPDRGNLTGYLLGIARNRISRLFRRQERIQAMDNDTLDSLEAAEMESEDARDILRLREALLDLPLMHREVIVLCDLEELPYATVAQIIQCPVGTVRSRLHRARALLGSHVVPPSLAPPPVAPVTSGDPTPRQMDVISGCLSLKANHRRSS
jgi:RNA polymerase sigma-70 factor, ECF subfamily